MNVTSGNFEVVLKEITDLLPSCVFMSIDEEMTGVRLWMEAEYNWMDTPRDRYRKMRTIVQTFDVIQFGLCLFHRHPRSRALIARPYNFYVFPHTPEHSVCSSRLIALEPSAIAFHTEYKMDFNKWMYEGVGYMDRPAEEKAQKELEEDFKQNPQATNEQKEQKEKDFLFHLGFRRLFKLLCYSHIPLVGHNCFLDVMFMINSFETNLPDSLHEFILLLSSLFPLIYDTKILAHSPLMHIHRPLLQSLEGDSRSSALHALYDLLRASDPYVTVELPEPFQRYQGTDVVHEAGYDAFMTGVVFANLHDLTSASAAPFISHCQPLASSDSFVSSSSSSSTTLSSSTLSSPLDVIMHLSTTSLASSNISPLHANTSGLVPSQPQIPNQKLQQETAIWGLRNTFPLAKSLFNLVLDKDNEEQMCEKGAVLVIRLPKGFRTSDLMSLFYRLNETFKCGDPSLRWAFPPYTVIAVFFSSMDPKITTKATSADNFRMHDAAWMKSFIEAIRADTDLEVHEWKDFIAKRKRSSGHSSENKKR